MKTHEINKIRPFSALIDACWWEPYSLTRLLKDAIAGVTVGIIAIPLAMALAIASGVPPQYGLYTAAIAGIVIAVSGGSRQRLRPHRRLRGDPVSGFAAVRIGRPAGRHADLRGVSAADGAGALWPADRVHSAAGDARLYLRYRHHHRHHADQDFFGLQLAHTPENYVGKLYALLQALPTLDFGDTLIGAVTLLILIFWPKLGLRVPATCRRCWRAPR